MWTGLGESAPKKAKTIPSFGKVMATIFWDSLILIDYLQKGKSITGEYYASLLDRFDAILKEKRPHLEKNKCFSITTMHQLTRVPLQRPNYLVYATKSFTLLHPPYSPNLAPSDYFLFPNMETWLGDERFSSNEEIIAATSEYFEGFDKNYFLQGIKKLEYRYNKCIQLKGDYVEKLEFLL